MDSVVKRMSLLDGKGEAQVPQTAGENDLIKTIHVPRALRDLTAALPTPRYDDQPQVRHCLCLVFPLPSWLKHRLCLVFPLPSWLKHRICLVFPQQPQQPSSSRQPAQAAHRAGARKPSLALRLPFCHRLTPLRAVPQTSCPSSRSRKSCRSPRPRSASSARRPTPAGTASARRPRAAGTSRAATTTTAGRRPTPTGTAAASTAPGRRATRPAGIRAGNTARTTTRTLAVGLPPHPHPHTHTDTAPTWVSRPPPHLPHSAIRVVHRPLLDCAWTTAAPPHAQPDADPPSPD